MTFQLLLHGRNIPITEGLQNATQEKLGKVFAHFDFLKRADVTLSVDKNPRIQENHHVMVVLHVNGGLLKLETRHTDLYYALDDMAETALNTLRKYKHKTLKRTKAGRSLHGTSLRIVGVQEALQAEAFSDPEPLTLLDFSDDGGPDADTLLLAELQQQELERQERELRQRYPEAYAS